MSSSRRASAAAAQQAITSQITNAPSGAAENNVAQTKERHSRTDRRAFAKEKKSKQDGKKPAHPKDSRKKDFKTTGGPSKKIKSIDDVIAYLLSIKGKDSIDEVIAFLLTVRNTSGNARSLESRVTKDAPKKAEPTAKQLEKRQKRKEQLAERRKAKLEYRAEQAANGTQGAEAGPADVPEQQPQGQTWTEDEMDFSNL